MAFVMSSPVVEVHWLKRCAYNNFEVLPHSISNLCFFILLLIYVYLTAVVSPMLDFNKKEKILTEDCDPLKSFSSKCTPSTFTFKTLCLKLYVYILLVKVSIGLKYLNRSSCVSSWCSIFFLFFFHSKACTDESPVFNKLAWLGLEVLTPSKAFTPALWGALEDFRDTLKQASHP